MDSFPHRRRRSVPVSLILYVSPWIFFAGLAGAGSLTGPIGTSGRIVELEDVVQVPASTGGLSWYGHARINVLAEVPDGSGRIFVNDLNGPFYVLDAGTLYTYFDMLSLRPDMKRQPGLASGFVSFAFHPDFASNGLFYTVHAEFIGSTPANLIPSPEPVTPYVHHSVLTEWTASDPSSNLFSGTSRELIRIPAAHHSHNMGILAFDPNLHEGSPEYGLLYIPAGDFGAAVKLAEPGVLGGIKTPYSAMLRIAPLGGPFSRGGTVFDYGIPPSNPYAASADPEVLGEIYAHGFRNGHRIVFDRTGSGPILSIDIGEKNVEEINILESGGNYGWPDREGSFDIDVVTDPNVVSPLPGSDPVPYVYPVTQYDHEDGRAIAGAEVLRYPANAFLAGEVIFGDIVDGRLMHASLAELVAADDGDPMTTAAIYDLILQYDGEETTLLDHLIDLLGKPSLNRVDLRLHSDLSGQIWVTTKQDGYLRKLNAVELHDLLPVPGANVLGLLTLVGGVAALGARAIRRRSPDPLRGGRGVCQ